jgi:hypothetical protein
VGLRLVERGVGGEWRYKSGEQGRRTTGARFAGDEDLI